MSSQTTGISRTDEVAAPREAARWRWSSWPLTRQLPLLTAVIIVLVVGTSLALTYGALRQARIEATYDRLRRLARQIALNSDQSIKARALVFRQVTRDSAVLTALHAAERGTMLRADDAVARTAAEALLRLRMAPDSSLPIEVWTTDGRRVLHVGQDVRGDSLNTLRPELRARNGRAVTEIPTGRSGSDSIRYGALYSSGGRVLFWTIVPIVEGNQRMGYLAQQRAFRSTPQARATMQELLGNGATLNLHNTTDRFWSNFMGEPISPLTGLDESGGDYVGERKDVGSVLASESLVPGTPWVFTIEAPVATVLDEPQATLRRLAMINLFIAAFGVLAAWVASRRITNPLVTLTSASDAIAGGDYGTRLPFAASDTTRNEVSRLSATFNRMAEEIETSHRELEQQVQEARSVSRQLELTNDELRRISADAREARDAAMQANRAKGDFLAVMSHELRTPLNAIGGYAEILQLGIYGPVAEKQLDALGRIVRSQQMLLSLINDVLNFAKLDAGQVQYHMANVSVVDALAQVEPLVAPQIEAKRQKYRFEPCDPTLVVRADREKLTQIVLNLLSNANKFTAPEGLIRLTCEADRDWVRIQVHDSGAGIPANRLDSIFDPFVQVDRALNRPHEGVGLGLSISRDLAHGMGGTLTAESVVGTGSIFTLRLKRGDPG